MPLNGGGLGGTFRIRKLRARLALERPVATYQGDPTGARQFLDSVMTGMLDECFDLLLLPRDLDHQLVGTDVEDPPPEDLHQGRDLRTKSRRRLDLDQHQIALDR